MAVFVSPRERIDWKTERERIDLGRVATNLLGPAPGRRGEKGKRLWWVCPFHEDRNPSFCVDPSSGWWHCYGCGEHGDAATLVMKLNGVTFLEAIAHLTGKDGGKPLPRTVQPSRPSPRNKPTIDEPSGLSYESALALLEAARRDLWSSLGVEALRYLTGPERGLSNETIRSAQLGLVDRPLDLPGRPRGIVIPWQTDSRLTLIKLRQMGGRLPKYVEVFRDRCRHLGIFPRPESIHRGLPLVVVEGEFDALCLGEALSGLASVVTTGSASQKPSPEILGRMIRSPQWFIATDNDPAGDKAAESWPRGLRVRPPAQFNDWSEAKRGGVNLRRWWDQVLSGNDRPLSYSWEDLATWRWGPALHDTETQPVDE